MMHALLKIYMPACILNLHASGACNFILIYLLKVKNHLFTRYLLVAIMHCKNNKIQLCCLIDLCKFSWKVLIYDIK